MTTTIEFFRVQYAGSDEFVQCMNIYREAFPVYERQPEQVLVDRVEKNECILVAGKLNHEITCMAIIWEFDNIPFIFLDYFAVSIHARAQGIGRKLLRFLISTWLQTGKFMVMEVEHPEQGVNQQERKQRISFYSRNGAVLQENLRYFLPPLGGATSAMEMKLMVVPDPTGVISNQQFTDLVETIYRKIYGREKMNE